MNLTRKQIQQLCEIADHLHEIELFELEQSNLSGIGPTIQVKFSIFGNRQDTSVDITDVESW